MSAVWQHEWASIRARVDGLVGASALIASATHYKRIGNYLDDQRVTILADLTTLFSSHSALMVPSAVARFDKFRSSYADTFKATDPDHLQSMVAFLVGLMAELEALLANRDAIVQRIAERAFLHLRRLIVADPSVAKKWVAAYSDGEVACEKLGGAHLLHHGIYAFKTNAEGARTDLILTQPLVWQTDLEMSVDGLVLTEWKKVTDIRQTEMIAQVAQRQTEEYARGALVGCELASVRYIVLVSEANCPAVGDVSKEGILYRHINISVKPSTPSVVARSAGGKA